MYIDSIDSYVQDVIQHVLEMQKMYPSVPCFLMGHSMVGLICINIIRLCCLKLCFKVSLVSV